MNGNQVENKDPNSLLATLLRALKDPVVPPAPHTAEWQARQYICLPLL